MGGVVLLVVCGADDGAAAAAGEVLVVMDLLDALLPTLEGRAPGPGAGAGLQDELLLLVQAPLLSCQAVPGCGLAGARECMQAFLLQQVGEAVVGCRHRTDLK